MTTTSSWPATLLLPLSLFIAACSEPPETPPGGSCDPIGATFCHRNVLTTCVDRAGPDGLPIKRDCGKEGLVCLGDDFFDKTCAKAKLGWACDVRDQVVCDERGVPARCVWVSEEPHPRYRGDVGAWRPCGGEERSCKQAAPSCR